MDRENRRGLEQYGRRGHGTCHLQRESDDKALPGGRCSMGQSSSPGPGRVCQNHKAERPSRPRSTRLLPHVVEGTSIGLLRRPKQESAPKKESTKTVFAHLFRPVEGS